jgi:nitroreductase
MALRSAGDVRAFRSSPSAAAGRPPPAAATGQGAVTPWPDERLSADPIEVVIRRRGSSRRLAREPVPAGEFAAILDEALAEFPTDWNPVGVEVGTIAMGLEGIAPGSYRYLAGGRFVPIREGDFRPQAGFLCLEQRLGADAAATTFLMADLARAVRERGARGYAAAQLEAAVAAGRLYLGAYAQCLGASGITFYDDEARTFLETESEPMMAVVMGPEGHRRSIRRCREAMGPV